MDEEAIKESLDEIIDQIEAKKKSIDNSAKLNDMFASLFGDDFDKSNDSKIYVRVGSLEIFRRLTQTEQYKYADDITLEIKDFTELTDEDIELISSSHADIKLNADNIRGASLETLKKLGNIRYGFKRDNYTDENPYTTEQMQEMLAAIDSFKGQILSKPSEFEKFMEIYKILMLSNDYDFGGISTDKGATQEQTNASRSLMGAVLHGSVVCHGFALELQQMLSYYGLDARFIGGSKHAWNQVKIDGNWYNTDLTFDYANIRKYDEKKLKYCLIGDKEFYESHTLDGSTNIVEECPTDFPREPIDAHLQDIEDRKLSRADDLGKGLVTLSQLKEIAYSTCIEPEFMHQLKEAKTHTPDIRRENEQNDERDD